MGRTDKGDKLRLRFTADGKIWFIVLKEEEKPGRLEGAYQVDGDSLNIKLFGGNETWKIMTLTATELVVTFTEGGKAKTDTYKKFDADGKAAKNKEKLVGTWEIAKGPPGFAGVTVEFAKDGKLTLKDGKATIKGTYEVAGDSVISFDTEGPSPFQWKFKALTNKAMTIQWNDHKNDKKTIEFKKK